MAKKNNKSKNFAQAKRNRRQWLAFVRMCRYGVNNFSRNAWLTIAATAVMTITLLVIFISVAAYGTLNDTVAQIRDKVDMSLYVKTDTTAEQAEQIKQDISKLSSVTDVRYITPAEARKEFAQNNKSDTETLEALKQASNKLPGTYRINVEDINNTDQLREFIESNELIKQQISPNHEPSFAGTKLATIEAIGRWASFAVKVGLGASIVFIGISSLIVFNTIRMAIFNRSEEIEMMKLIGADKAFIRGPFIVEAVVYGFIAAVIATGLGVFALYSSSDKLLSYQINVQPTLDVVTAYIGVVLIAMIIAGAVIGVISSLFATRRYLKI
ncbi:MAG: permease-like cell division protein FtsX [bacterium]|nr:permease-like cell division protein FtsX [bacterium]MDN5835123.1 permease-like cell division protein FtsX [bacterium]